LILVYFYMAVTPLVVCTHKGPPYLCAFFTLISVICMLGLDLIASELENPFGDDPNDLPVDTIHVNVVRSLLLLLDKRMMTTPHLATDKFMRYDDLKRQSDTDFTSLKQFHLRIQRSFGGLATRQISGKRKKQSSMMTQLQWAHQQFPDGDKIKKWLRLSTTNLSDEFHEISPNAQARPEGGDGTQTWQSTSLHLGTPCGRLVDKTIDMPPAVCASDKQPIQNLESCLDIVESRAQDFLDKHLEKHQVLCDRVVAAVDTLTSVIQACKLHPESLSNKGSQPGAPWQLPCDPCRPANRQDSGIQYDAAVVSSWRRRDPPLPCCALSTSERTRIAR